ncbi:MAG: hypothetical protein ACI4ES_06595 [Roseburia sp.]
MATISSYDSASIGVLFSSVSTNKNANWANSYSSLDLLGINYSDYATIKSGAYYKLVKAYYSDSEASSNVISSTATSKDDVKTLAKIESTSEELKEASEALQTTGSKSVFKKVTTKNEDGTTSTDYDTDAIYKAVKKFTDSYNSMVDELEDANTRNIISTAKSMVTYVNNNSRLLSKIGITIGADSRLTVDEKAFKESDMETVKSLFQSTGSFGYQVAAKASMIHYYAENEASKSNTYSSSGMYTYNYNTGSIYSSET